MKFSNYTYAFFLLLLMNVFSNDVSAQGLKDLAAAKGKFIGNILKNEMFDGIQASEVEHDLILKTEYNTLVAENKMKMDNLLNKRPVDPFNVQISDINTADIDTFLNYADAKGMRKRGHTMIWFSQAPQWLTTDSKNWTSQQIYDFSKSYILALSTYTSGKIDEWDVLNEAIENNTFRTNTWYDKVNSQANNEGKIGYLEYFSNLFKWARQGDPNARLFYNDFSIEAFGTGKNNFMRKMVKDLKTIHNAPINGVGLQSHFTLNEMSTSFINKVGQTIDDLGTSRFVVNITELDIRICGNNANDIAKQATAYKDFVTTVFSKRNCNTVLIWGVSDKDSWIPAFFAGCGKATLHDATYQKKPAYEGLKNALTDLVLTESINAVSGSNTVIPGLNTTVFVDYFAKETRDLVVVFQKDSSPYTVYQSLTKTVPAGVGSLSIPILIPSDVPLVNEGYQYQIFLAPIGGNWDNKISNLEQVNVSAINNTLTINDNISVSDNFENLTITKRINEEVLSIKGLKTGFYNLKIYNILGQELLQNNISINRDSYELEVSKLNSGLYILQINQFGKIVQKKFVK